MPANFTRRLDLFRDAGFAAPEAAVETLRALLSAELSADKAALEKAVATARLGLPLSADLQRLASLSPEWLFARKGDLTTLFWLAGQEHAGALPLRAFVLAVLDSLLKADRRREVLALLRFLSEAEFDFGQLYGEKGPAYGFFREREPNPLVFKLLAYFEERREEARGSPGKNALPPALGEQLRILDLGAGIGNDALGFLASPLVADYLAADLSRDELDKAESRAAKDGVKDARLRTVQGDFVGLLRDPAKLAGVNLVYSYSSLHYFNSAELDEILDHVHDLLVAAHGHLAFAIKGEGSIWDGQGIPLYRPDVWINLDGQSRWFPSVPAIDSLLDRHGFALKLHELHEHWGYSETGKRDVFHYVLAEAV